MNGYVIEATYADGNAAGGKRIRKWIGIADSHEQMMAQIRGRAARVVEAGPAVLHRARELGLADNDMKQLDN